MEGLIFGILRYIYIDICALKVLKLNQIIFFFSVLSLANYCSQSLCNLKLSFCTDISQNTVAHLAKNCRR